MAFTNCKHKWRTNRDGTTECFNGCGKTLTHSYICRNDNVLVRIVELGETAEGIAMPDSAIQGKEFHVVAMGPDVEDLQLGDKVLLGTLKADYFPLPNDRNLILVKQEHVVLVVK